MKQPCERIAAIRFVDMGCRSGVSAVSKLLALAIVLAPSVLTARAAGGEQVSTRDDDRRTPLVAFGTWRGLNIMVDLLQHFESDRHGHFIKFTPLDTHQIPGYLARHECDIGMTLDSELPAPTRRELARCERFTVGRFAVGIAVNSKNPIRAIVSDDVRRLFFGAVTSWKDIAGSGNSHHMNVCRPLRDSIVGTVLRKKLLLRSPSGEILLEPPGVPGQEERSGRETIAAIIKDANAIGFVLYDCGEHLETRVRVLPLAMNKNSKAVAPSGPAVADGTYPLTDTITLYLHPDAPSSAKEFCEFAVGPKGAEIARKYGLWPEYQLEKVRGEVRLREMQAGKGSPVRVCGEPGGEPLAQGLAVPYVKAKALVQVKYREQGAETLDEFVEEGELLIWEGKKPGGKDPLLDSAAPSVHAGLGTRAVAVIVRPDNAANELTLEDLRLVYSGQIDKWPGVAGTAARIRIVGLASDSPVMKLVEEAVGSGRWAVGSEKREGTAVTDGDPPLTTHHSPSAGRHARIERRGDTEKVVLSVASQPGAIGFVDLARVDRHETRVKLVAILAPGAKKAEVPMPEKVPEGYPLARPVMLYLVHPAEA